MDEEMPKPKVDRKITVNGDKIKITASETATYTKSQIDEVYKSLLRTKRNIEGQRKQAQAQLDQLKDHILPNMEINLDKISKDLEELKEFVSDEAKKFDPTKQ